MSVGEMIRKTSEPSAPRMTGCRKIPALVKSSTKVELPSILHNLGLGD